MIAYRPFYTFGRPAMWVSLMSPRKNEPWKSKRGGREGRVHFSVIRVNSMHSLGNNAFALTRVIQYCWDLSGWEYVLYADPSIVLISSTLKKRLFVSWSKGWSNKVRIQNQTIRSRFRSFFSVATGDRAFPTWIILHEQIFKGLSSKKKKRHLSFFLTLRPHWPRLFFFLLTTLTS